MHYRTRALPVVLIAGLLWSGFAGAAAVRVEGRVVDEGGKPIPGASVSLRGAAVPVAAGGEFTVSITTPTTVTIRADAPGYYPFLHTLHRSDFVAGRDARLPAIELVKKNSGRTLLLFAGDTMLSRRYFEPRTGEATLVRKGSVAEDGRKLLTTIKPYIELADYASTNMETQLSDETLHDRVPKSVTFYSPADLAVLLEWAGFDYVALGNNHMYDYRDEGLESTFAALETTGLDYSGGGHEEHSARRPANAIIGDRDYAYMSYVGWAGTFSPTQVAEGSKGGAALGNSRSIAEDLARLEKGTVTVLQLHAGLEYKEAPALSERTTMRQAIVDGVDVAIGHHPHVLQGFEIYGDRLIAYSLGNFLFDQYHYTTQLGMLLYVWMDGDTLHRAEAVPLHINGYVPTPATGAFRYAVLSRLARLADESACIRSSGFHAIVASCEGPRSERAQRVRMPEESGDSPIHLRTLDASPLEPVAVDAGERLFRLGTDISRRGDFEYARLFGTHDRTWIVGDHVSLKTGDDNRLEIRIPPGRAAVRTGMKVFERVFTPSNPATVSGRLMVEGQVRIRFLLQRRRMTEALDDELENGPITELGVWKGDADSWVDFSIDYNQPRVATRSVRLLIDVEDTSVEKNGATVALDDLAWVEWRTPWRAANAAGDDPVFATHVQLQSQRNR